MDFSLDWEASALMPKMRNMLLDGEESIGSQEELLRSRTSTPPSLLALTDISCPACQISILERYGWVMQQHPSAELVNIHRGPVWGWEGCFDSETWVMHRSSWQDGRRLRLNSPSAEGDTGSHLRRHVFMIKTELLGKREGMHTYPLKEIDHWENAACMQVADHFDGRTGTPLDQWAMQCPYPLPVV